MDYKKIKKRVYRCRVAVVVVFIVMINFIFLQSSGFASEGFRAGATTGNNYYSDILGKTLWILKEPANADDKKMFSGILFNPLKIMQSQMSFLGGVSYNGGNDEKDTSFSNESREEQEKASSIVINPFKLKDDAINKKDATVDVVGNPGDNSKKKILIYHTHTNEAYAEGNSGLSTTVAAVGDELAAQLEALGFTVIHDKTIHDIDYNNAYYSSHETLVSYLNSYGDFDLIIDLHRDGGPSKDRVTANISGDNVARIMFVTTETDPRYEAHMNNLNSIIGIANEIYPGLIMDKSIYFYKSGIIHYSQDLSDNAMLMEVGADTNELQEAKNSMKYMAVVFAKHLNSK